MDNIESKLYSKYKEIDEICEYNTKKVLDAFHNNNVSSFHFNSTSGYGYNDVGRDVIESVYKDIFKCEDALVRIQIISGTHAISTSLFGILRPNDTMLSITGLPYDTLHEVIGIKDNPSSLKSFNINYEQIELINNDFDYDGIKERLSLGFVKLVHIQRSKGYSNRDSISMDKVEKVIKLIKEVSDNTIVMVDNCYCEFVCKCEPTEVGADVVVGSLIKNLGGGIASNGGYICGKKDLINLCAERLNVCGEAKEVGSSLGFNKSLLLGLSLSPSVVRNALKVAIYTSYRLENLGYIVNPKWNEERVDIVQNVIFNDRNKLIKYCEGIQEYSMIDSNIKPIPSSMPGYSDEIIMASGSFTQGSSIEISCDAPLKEPYILFQQGSLTYEYGKLAVDNAINKIMNN